MVVADKPATEVPTATAEVDHPLDPLTAPEMRQASTLFRGHHRSRRLRFVSISLREPLKRSVAAFSPGDPIERRAFVVAIDRANGKVYEGVANLSAGAVESWVHQPGVQTSPTSDEYMDADRVIRADKRWRAAMQRRGVQNLDLVQIDPWPAGNFGDPREDGHRILRGIAYVRDEQASNGYARPVEGLVAVVDLTAKRVLHLVDEGDAPIPEADIRYDAESQTPRDDLKPLEITQPEGVSFTLAGHHLSWQRWRMRVSHHPREGLVIHQLGYEDRGELRSICYRMSLSEMVVPYGDNSPGQYWKNAFDSGEIGLGRTTNSLTLGCDCLGEIVYLDGLVAEPTGATRAIQNAICIHEEDFNVLWKHTNGANAGAAEVRRSRRLVVSSWATVGNYDYGFYWYFYEDGSIEHEIKLTGIIQTMAVGPEGPPRSAQMVAKNLAGPIHQHFFCVRMDMDIDGAKNTVYEVETRRVPPGPENEHHNVFEAAVIPIRSERESGRKVHSPTARHWRIANPDRTNAVGEPVAYALFPGETADLMAAPESAVAKRAEFATKQLWVTREAPDELYAAGAYPSQTTGGDGIPAFISAKRLLERQDIVLWYVVGTSHIIRPEDFPVSPTHRSGFALRPWGFFDTNPALDVAPSPMACGHLVGECSCDHGGGGNGAS